VETIRSAGVTDQNDPLLIQSRRAFQDSDVASIQALAYILLGDQVYLNAVDRILKAWSTRNVPTGHPIDETRLEGLIWAYDLVACRLSEDHSNAFKRWLLILRDKKEHWQFGPLTRYNNHRTHHLKIQILIDKVLGDTVALQRHRAEVETHLKVNLSRDTGASLDYEERDALYYHVFNLEAWYEIQLQLQCCEQSIARAYQFLAEKIRTGDTGGEFANSVAPIDMAREAAGFDYARANSHFNTQRAARVIAQYHTVVKFPPDPLLWSIATANQGSKKLVFYFVRRELWIRSP
jgi:hypothetical protein